MATTGGRVPRARDAMPDEIVPAFDATGKPSGMRAVNLDDPCTVGMAARIAKAIVREERWTRRIVRWFERARA